MIYHTRFAPFFGSVFTNRITSIMAKILACLFVAVGLQNCISPQQECEEAEILSDRKGTCLLFLSLDRNACLQREAGGELSPGTCESTERIGLLYCLDYLDRVDRCSKEPNIPILPKIVYVEKQKTIVKFLGSHRTVCPMV